MLVLYKNGKNLDFGEECIDKNKFHMYEKPVSIDEVDTKKIVLSNRESYGNKYFIGYDDYNDGMIPLYIRLPPVNALAIVYDNFLNII